MDELVRFDVIKNMNSDEYAKEVERYIRLVSDFNTHISTDHKVVYDEKKGGFVYMAFIEVWRTE